MTSTRERVAIAGLKVQDERLAAVDKATTPEELDRSERYYEYLALIAADPIFVSAFEIRFR